jgi:hypothetical protein
MGKMAALGVCLAMTSAAHAACPQELAIYQGVSGQGGLEFIGQSTAMAMSHEVRIIAGNELVMTGYVGVTQTPQQTFMFVPHQCPEGDVTGEELDACMVYEDVIYALDDKGIFGQLPSRGTPAADRILLPGFLQQLAAQTQRLDVDVAASDEIFQLSGCQE